jgi:hypothetical protein
MQKHILNIYHDFALKGTFIFSKDLISADLPESLSTLIISALSNEDEFHIEVENYVINNKFQMQALSSASYFSSNIIEYAIENNLIGIHSKKEIEILYHIKHSINNITNEVWDEYQNNKSNYWLIKNKNKYIIDNNYDYTYEKYNIKFHKKMESETLIKIDPKYLVEIK